MSESSAHEAYHELRRLARASELNTQQQFELYLHEAFLARLAQSPYKDQFVLKGGMLVAATGIRRATRDADLLALGISHDEALVKSIVNEITRIKLEDGITFYPESISSELARESDDYQSIRISMDATLGTANLKLKLDVNFGDPVSPVEVKYVPLLGRGGFRLLAYPVEMVVAEKVETMIARGEANTRERDFADVYLLIKSSQIDPEQLKDALVKTAHHRGRQLLPLSQTVENLGRLRQQNWSAYLQRSGLSTLPDEFGEVISEITDFIDPLLSGIEDR